MARDRTDLHNELQGLRSEIGASNSNAPAEVHAVAAAHGEIEKLLRDLEEGLKGAADEAGELVGEHPLAAVASAFLLGLVVGRILGKS